MNKDKVFEFLKKNTMIIVLLIVLGFFSWQTSGAILLPMNVSNLISQNAYVFILATGMLLCILTGGNIDLSVGSVVCFVGAVGAILMVNLNVPFWVAIIVMVIIGTAIGAFQGFWIAFVRIPPFIVTLAGMLAFRGLSNVVLNGLTVSIKEQTTFVNLFGGGADCYIRDFFGGESLNLTCLFGGILGVIAILSLNIYSRKKKIDSGYEVEALWAFCSKIILISAAILVFAYKLAQHKGIPTVLIWVLIVVIIYGYITSNTTTGRYFYAVGGNEKATKLSGIDTNKVYFLAYMNMGFLAALAGMVTIARLTSAQPTYGQNYEMDAIGSCFIGGASAYGGIGTVPGVIVGAVLMGVINLGMSLMGVDANMQKVVKGVVLLAAVIFDVVSKRGGKMIVKN
ncbi:xylose ABC transporter permease protein [Butyrivibrio proteoclasticus B316]|uniref:Xylose transport system permease protein XylH n=1 Tax=Butyrivibrio proteoclasticus (strain ATCC 51982 / DSM 14932 / B316) TaxID=515622 RepID=E0S290_BUTPB|nr:multiple monosaccharide ABC transporter permease [Butyrivibrio proteoclasticus]ADL33915.1 xylose ABC transporter permease protein [Butyrivibrio proteoclasticus B316]